jgi:hypothetical protein
LGHDWRRPVPDNVVLRQSAVRYVGSTTKDISDRGKVHWYGRKLTANEKLADLPADGIPEAVRIATVSDEKQLIMEKLFSWPYRMENELFNLRDGFAHTEASKKRISEAMRKSWARRQGRVSEGSPLP